MAVMDPCAPKRTLRAWQAEALPIVLDAIQHEERGLVEAVMGAGKSILIAEVLAEVLALHGPGAIVVTAPTTRLVEQLEETFVGRLGRQAVGVYYTDRKHPERRVVVCCNPSAVGLAEELAVMSRPVQLWVADEAHRTEAAEMKAAAEVFKAQAAIGFSATPFRSDEAQRLSLWDRVLFRYTAADAQRDGVIVPARVVPWTGAENVPVDQAVIEMIRTHGHGPGVVSATTIQDADAHAKTLCEAGIPSASVHSGHTRAQRDQLLERLRVGDLHCLVHVSLLAEGVDLPWLRWIALRRAVGARTRFVQEVGRVLRAFPGKAEGVILDPHDLFDAFSLTYAAMLGWEESALTSVPSEKPAATTEAEKRVRYARAKTELAAWARRLYLCAEADGLIPPSIIPAGEWRRKPPTGSQRGAVKRACLHGARWLPEAHAVVAALVCRQDAIVSSGMASDLLDLFRALAARKRHWSPPEPVEAPPGSAVDSGAAVAREEQRAAMAMLAADPKLYIAVVLRRSAPVVEEGGRTTVGNWAYVAVQHGKLISQNRVKLREEDRFGDLLGRVVRAARSKHPAPETTIVLPDSKYLPERLKRLPAVDVIPEKEHCAVKAAWKLLDRGANGATP